MQTDLIGDVAAPDGVDFIEAEKRWKKAKSIAEQQTGMTEGDGDDYWKYVAGVFKKSMGIVTESATISEPAAYDWKAELEAVTTFDDIEEVFLKLFPGVVRPKMPEEMVMESTSSLKTVIIKIGSDFLLLPLAEFIEKAKDYARSKYAGKTVVNQFDKAEILIPWQGIKHTFSGHVTKMEAAVALRLGEVIEAAEPLKQEQDKRSRDTILNVFHYRANVVVEGESAEINVVVREQRDGKRYYDHYEIK